MDWPNWTGMFSMVFLAWSVVHNMKSALSTCLSISNIHHYSILLPIHLFFVLLFSLHHTDTNIVSLICQCLSGQNNAVKICKKQKPSMTAPTLQLFHYAQWTCTCWTYNWLRVNFFLQIRLNITILTSCHLLHCSIRLRRALTTKDELPFKLQL